MTLSLTERSRTVHTGWVHHATLIAAGGSFLVGGVFFAFSTFIMPGLRRTSTGDGIRAMQAINKAAVGPSLMVALFGVAVLCVVVGVPALRSFDVAASRWTVAAGATYLVTAIVVTIGANVPRNDRLAKLDPRAGDAAAVWHEFLAGWTAWNHVRTIGCLVAGALFVKALLSRA